MSEKCLIEQSKIWLLFVILFIFLFLTEEAAGGRSWYDREGQAILAARQKSQQMSDRLLRGRQGRVLQAGSPRQLATSSVAPNKARPKRKENPEFLAGSFIITQRALDEAPYRYSTFLTQVLTFLSS